MAAIVKLSRSNRRGFANAVEIATLGLMVSVKWDIASQGHPKGYQPSPQELADAGVFTEGQLSSFRDDAAQILVGIAAKSSWWTGFWQGVAAAAAWSGIVLVAFLGQDALRGGDIAGLLRSYPKSPSVTAAQEHGRHHVTDRLENGH